MNAAFQKEGKNDYKGRKSHDQKFLFISSFFYLAAAALPMTEARAADPDTDPVNITCPGGSCDNQTIDNNGEMTVNAEGVAKENTIGDTGKMTVNDGGIAQKLPLTPAAPFR